MLLLPSLADACMVCTGGNTEASQWAFIWTTAFMSVLPPLMIGGLVWWIRRLARQRAEQDARAEAVLDPTP